MHPDFPLFPLPLVAMPHCRLPLQIFEPRYLDLVKTSLAKQQCFGIVTVEGAVAGAVAGAVEGAVEGTVDDDSEADLDEVIAPAANSPPILPLGTAVRIVDFSQQSNGLLGIVCEGMYKFRVHDSRINGSGLRVASIEELPSEALRPEALRPSESPEALRPSESPDLPLQFDELISVLQALLEHGYARKLGYPNGCDEHYWRQHATELAWHLAYLLPLPDAIKYRWLAMDNTQARLAALLDAVNLLQDAG